MIQRADIDYWYARAIAEQERYAAAEEQVKAAQSIKRAAEASLKRANDRITENAEAMYKADNRLNTMLSSIQVDKRCNCCNGEQ